MTMMFFMMLTILRFQGSFGVDTRNVNTGTVIGDLNTGYADQPMYVLITLPQRDGESKHRINQQGNHQR